MKEGRGDKGGSISRRRTAIQNLSDRNLSRECPGELKRRDGKNRGKVPIKSSQLVMVGLEIVVGG